jgi:iron complex transport system permease protein
MNQTVCGTQTKRLSIRAVWASGSVLLLIAFITASGQGAFAISPSQLLRIVSDSMTGVGNSPEHLVFMNIRLPRLLLGIAAGAGLGMSGALMQGLFRNPLADPGLIGVSSGAALAAGITIVLGAAYFPELPRKLGSWTLVLMAFAGGLSVTVLIYALAQSSAGTQVGLMLLAGIAVNSLAGAGLGFLNFMATDEQLRSIQFWLMGSLGGARWSAVQLVGAITLVSVVAGLAMAQPLNAIALGEAQASMLGVNVERVKKLCIVLTAMAVGGVTATTGIIGFVGLIAPHCIRIIAGPDHRVVLPGSALLGAALVLAADAVARTVAKPAELPLGVLTAFVGVPFFLLLLRSSKFRVTAL